MKCFCIAFTIICLLGAGCNRAAQEVVRAATVEPVKRPVPNDVSREEAQGFATALLAAAERGSAADIGAMIDWATLIRRGAQGLRASDSMLADFEKGAQKAAVVRGVPAVMAEVAQGTARLRHLGSHERHGESWEVFRRIVTAGGFEHTAFRLSRGSDGKVRAIDIELMTVGEPLSASVRRMLLPALATDSKSVMARFTGSDALVIHHAGTIKEAQAALSEGRPADAKSTLDKLPEALRNEKSVLLMRIQAGVALNEEEHVRAIEALAKAYPNEPVTGVHMIDGYGLTKRYDEALKAVARTEKLSAPDPYFEVSRANILVLASRLDEAKAAAQRAVDKEPSLIEAHWVLVTVALQQRAFAEVTRLLVDMSSRFDLTYDLEAAPEYSEYIASPEYGKLKLELSK